MTSSIRAGAPNSVAAPTAPQRGPEPVTRRYSPDTAALDELVEVLHRLLMDALGDSTETESAPVDSACLSSPHE